MTTNAKMGSGEKRGRERKEGLGKTSRPHIYLRFLETVRGEEGLTGGPDSLITRRS